MAHILLAEDDESLRKFLAAALVKAGHAVSDFGDGGEAFECLQGFTFDLLLTDIVMPEGISGPELAARLQAQDSTLKVIYTSGYTADLAPRGLRLEEGVNFLQKPVALDHLLETVGRVLDGPARK